METISKKQTKLQVLENLPPFSDENPFQAETGESGISADITAEYKPLEHDKAPAITQEDNTETTGLKSTEQSGCDNKDEISVLPTDQEKSAPAESKKEDEEGQKRREHEAAEAQRKAEWESRQQAKKAVEQEKLTRLASMSDDEAMMASMQRIGEDTEKLTRRNMKEHVSEHIQTKCLTEPAFARLALHPQKSMINCFQYINRKAREFAEEEMKNHGIKVEPGKLFVYSSDIPDDLCYQWAEDYFNDLSVPEDQEEDEKFKPEPYVGKSKYKAASKKSGEKKPVEKKTETQNTEKKTESEKDGVTGQLSFGNQLSFDLGAQTA